MESTVLAVRGEFFPLGQESGFRAGAKIAVAVSKLEE